MTIQQGFDLRNSSDRRGVSFILNFASLLDKRPRFLASMMISDVFSFRQDQVRFEESENVAGLTWQPLAHGSRRRSVEQLRGHG